MNTKKFTVEKDFKIRIPVENISEDTLIPELIEFVQSAING